MQNTCSKTDKVLFALAITPAYSVHTVRNFKSFFLKKNWKKNSISSNCKDTLYEPSEKFKPGPSGPPWDFYHLRGQKMCNLRYEALRGLFDLHLRKYMCQPLSNTNRILEIRSLGSCLWFWEGSQGIVVGNRANCIINGVKGRSFCLDMSQTC